ncbi:MogA/MoaB family molybdenum cofactor biosynthesis protein [Acidaminobacter sp. JC074]|uniref:MogA/MoaB family molybdenum cofactor biosynthesis protein n=1 Tax=Acidaminobacter sp. JC074 TaxID=2530199 RepID=UPI001F0DB584|nr:MogA/MoaB family molybdenum cofactor biosynthesis protein [Acidaminobacter sp. JC074]MCH4889006.1 MogA/MoaB family molybdenum cofactor biosynthesis protein [Acidaminobacter sp. JC074]
MFKVCIITVSDKGSIGERIDKSGEVIRDLMEAANYQVLEKVILPDEVDLLKEQMIKWADNQTCDLILTTGGTGFSPRDFTPEATKAVIDREVPGIPEAMRAYSLSITKKAMLSRAAAGIRKSTLIINLPGSPKAVKETLEYILPPLEHGLEIMTGKTGECAR